MSPSFVRTTRRWSIARRVTLWVGVCVVGVLVIESAAVSWVVSQTLGRELDALVMEEAAELRAMLLEMPASEESLRQLGAALDAQHPEANISLRFRRGAGEALWVTAGTPAEHHWAALAGREQLGRGGPFETLRLATIDLPGKALGGGRTLEEEPLRAQLLVDGAPRHARLKRLSTLVLLGSLATGCGVLALGATLAGQLSRLLRQVAANATIAHTEGHSAVDVPEEAPEEVRAVADAFRGSLEKLTSSHARNLLLTAGLAHELRAPLQNLITDAEVGLLKPRSTEDYAALVKAQLAEMRKLALVVDNLITLTSLRDRDMLFRGERFDLAKEASIRLLHEEQEAARRNVSIEVIEQGDCHYFGDREALVLMLRNLVGNAAGWTPEGSTVEVLIDGEGESLVVTVDDEGPGVLDRDAEAIFEAFYQGMPPDGNRAGYGLGLALARSAARADGGDITVGRSPHGGGRFTVELPRPKSAQP